MNITVERILLLLDRRNADQKDLADYLGTKKQTVTDWKKGKTKSYQKSIDKIAEFFGVSVDYLLGRTNDENGSSNYVNGNNSVQAVQNDNCEITLNVNNSTNDELMEIKTILDSLSVRDRHELLNMIFGYADTHVSKNSNLKMEGE